MALRVRILRPTVGTGGVLGAGELLQLPDAEARLLCAQGKAEFVLDGPFDGPDRGAPVPQHRDPAPTRARGGR